MEMISKEDSLELMPGREEKQSGLSNKHNVLKTNIGANLEEEPMPDGLQMAAFASGCYWRAEKGFWRMPGVYSTAVGYCGGYTPNPTSDETCTSQTGHTETVQIYYDETKISYVDLLRQFWESHDPSQKMAQGNDKGN